jgi:hypothetical protein
MTRRNQILISVAAFGAVVVAFYFLALAPKREEVARLDGEVAAKQAEVQAARAVLSSYEEARAGYKANYARLARLGKAVPGDDDIRSLLVQLEDASDLTGVDFQKIELTTSLAGSEGTSAPADAAATPAGTLASAPGTVPFAGGTLAAMPFSFTFNGGFFDLSNFLARVEHFVTMRNDRLGVTGRLLRLETLQLQAGPAGYPEMAAQIGAASYLVPPTEGVQTGATGDAAGGATPPAGPDGTTPGTTTATATGAP